MRIYTPLVAEHDVILRMTEVIRKLTERTRECQEVSQVNLDNVIDFLCMYVDRCHHAKEEDILFSHCEKKGINGIDKKIMEELIGEHVFIMRTVGEILEARQTQTNGHRSTGETLGIKLEMLATYYPEHMRKEKEIFFPKAVKYFSREEQYSMLREFWKFNEKVLFEKYYAILDRLETLTGNTTDPSVRPSRSS